VTEQTAMSYRPRRVPCTSAPLLCFRGIVLIVALQALHRATRIGVAPIFEARMSLAASNMGNATSGGLTRPIFNSQSTRVVASKSNAIIAGLIRPNTISLGIIEYVEAIGSLFDKYIVIVTGHHRILGEWTKRNPNVHVVTDPPGLPRMRMAKMAQLRNRLLKSGWELSQRKSFRADFIIMIDFDIEAIDLDGFGRVKELVRSGFVGAAGNGGWRDGCYYDIFAWRGVGRDCPQWDPRAGVMYAKDGAYTKSFHRVIPTRAPPFSVDSAWSGAAIYNATAVFGSEGFAGDVGRSVSASNSLCPGQYKVGTTSYGPSAAIGYEGRLPCTYGSGGVEDAELIPFSVCLNARAKKWGLKPLHVDPSWLVDYGTARNPCESSRHREVVSPVKVHAPFSDEGHAQDAKWIHGHVDCRVSPDMISSSLVWGSGCTPDHGKN